LALAVAVTVTLGALGPVQAQDGGFIDDCFFFADVAGLDVGSHADRDIMNWANRGVFEVRVNRLYVIDVVRTCMGMAQHHPEEGTSRHCLAGAGADERGFR
jgi:hypothetical protein